MAGNIKGATNPTPGVFDVIETQSSGASVPGGIRVAALIGEGSSSETIVSAALGNGKDGLDSSYSSPTGADGRHFALDSFPIIPNRTKLYRNGIPLTGIESLIDDGSFSSLYDYRIDVNTGHIELQKAYLADQGGLNYRVSATNVGDGYLSSLTLTDVNAPKEIWTIKCVSVQRNALNQPVAKTAKFIATGTVSGNALDANGNPVIWVANGQTTTNGILKFAINEKASALREGDSFIVQVKSGVLTRNDSLTASYIPTNNINDPEYLTTTSDIQKKHGIPSLDNNLALGCQLAFANAAPGIMTVQAAPAIPRRTSYEIDPDGINASSTNDDDFIFPLPTGVVPDVDADIHLFALNKTTNVETQLLANKFPFYSVGTSGQPTIHEFITDNATLPAGNSFSYTIIQRSEAEVSGFDGKITGSVSTLQGTFSTASVEFDASYVGKILRVLDATNVANNNYYLITNVSDGELQVTASDSSGTALTSFEDFTNETSTAFQIMDPSSGTAIGAGTDGTLTKVGGTGTATLVSNSTTGFDFSSVSSLIGKQIKLNGSDNNDGLYAITSYNAGDNSIVIEKAITEEDGLRFEVIDLDTLGEYLVVNKNVVPNGNTLRITLVDERDASFYDAGWTKALEAMEGVEIDILAPLPKSTISAIFQNAFNHCVSMSSVNNKKERVLFMGAINGLTPDNLRGVKLAAVEQLGVFEGIPKNDISTLLAGEMSDISNYSVPDAFGHANQAYRCVYFYPDQIVVSVNGSNILVDGFYIAAAAAGYLSAITNIAMPLTNKTLSGFTILRNKQLSPLVLGQLAQAGVCVLQPVQGGGRVVWGITATQSGFTEEEEISIVFIRDRIAKALRDGFAGYIGLPEDTSMIATLSARAMALLKSFASQGLITAYDSLLVQRDSVDPTQWDITFRCQPNYPCNFIFIKASIGLLS